MSVNVNPLWNTEMREVGSGVYAYVQAKGTWFTGNSGLIVGKRDSIVIDSLANATMVQAFIDEIQKRSSNPINYLINTHQDHDHRWTNHYFAEANTICQTRCREETQKELNNDPSSWSRWFPEMDYSGAKNTLQDITFEQNLVIYQQIEGGLREIHLIYPGIAHSVSDVIVYLPLEKVVFCGDLLFTEPCTPFVMNGHFLGYIKTLDYIASLDADIYVSGHGPVTTRSSIYKARDYLTFVYNEARKRFKLGMNAFEAAEDINLGIYDKWFDRERIIGNVARAFSEFRGELPAAPLSNISDIFTRMINYRISTSNK